MDKNNNENKEQQRFSISHGTGAISSVVFMVIAFIIMLLLSKYLG